MFCKIVITYNHFLKVVVFELMLIDLCEVLKFINY
jgi:hypothetical protein